MTATVLMVDDEPDLETLVLRKFRRLRRDGLIDFLFAHDGIEALRAIDRHPHIDLVVLDINMPRMDGLSLLQKLQERDDRKSAIVVSAYGDMGNIRTAMNRGAFDFLTKPIDFSDLEATILKTLRHVESCAKRIAAKPTRSVRMPHCPAIFLPNWPGDLRQAARTAWLCIGVRSESSLPISRALHRWSRWWCQSSLRNCSKNMSAG